MFTEAEPERNLKETSRPVTLLSSELQQAQECTMLVNISYQIPNKCYDMSVENKCFDHVEP